MVLNSDEYTALVAAVIDQAISDLYLPPNHGDNSVSFFLCPDDYPWTFNWCCAQLNLEPSCILGQHKNRINTCIAVKSRKPRKRRKLINTAKLIASFQNKGE